MFSIHSQSALDPISKCSRSVPKVLPLKHLKTHEVFSTMSRSVLNWKNVLKKYSDMESVLIKRSVGRERGSHALGVYTMQDTSRMRTASVKLEEKVYGSCLHPYTQVHVVNKMCHWRIGSSCTRLVHIYIFTEKK